MANWSAENATKAYLRALKIGKRGKDPDVAEFISALAAGNNAQLMVIATAGTAGSSTLSLVAAAGQTGGRVVCILPSLSYLHASKLTLGSYSGSVKFVTGDAKTLLLSNDYKGTDFVLIDCHIGDYKGIYKAAEERLEYGSRGVIVGYNAFHKGLPFSSQYKSHLLPIGQGLVVSRISSVNSIGQVVGPSSHKKKEVNGLQGLINALAKSMFIGSVIPPKRLKPRTLFLKESFLISHFLFVQSSGVRVFNSLM